MKMSIDVSFFEMLLNSLANQKYLHEIKEKDREVFQKVIDKTWCKGMEKLSEIRRG